MAAEEVDSDTVDVEVLLLDAVVVVAVMLVVAPPPMPEVAAPVGVFVSKVTPLGSGRPSYS